jgi:hypothetical protein
VGERGYIPGSRINATLSRNDGLHEDSLRDVEHHAESFGEPLSWLSFIFDTIERQAGRVGGVVV